MKQDKNMNGVVLIHKPKGKTSHDMVSFVRRLFGIRRVGHTGTLDPDATGVLPICLGMATKASQYIMDSEKVYVARMQFGVATDTQDASGRVIHKTEVIQTKTEIHNVICSFIGEIEQIPPMYSAVKHSGKKLYELARAGIEVERKPRKVTIHNIHILEIDLETKTALIEVTCSKGTYIRTLINDIGEKLGCYAHMVSLIRTKSGGFDLDETYTCQSLEEMNEEGTLHSAVLPTHVVFKKYPAIILDEKNTWRARNGMQILNMNARDGQRYRIFAEDETFLCLSVGIQGGHLKMLTSFWSE